MNKVLKLIGSRTLITSMLLFFTFMIATSATFIGKLQVEYTKTPIGIDVKTPRFSWQMAAPAGERNYNQTAYQIVVNDPEGKPVWDSKKITSDISLGILYAGSPLKATSKYNWTVTVWDQKGET